MYGVLLHLFKFTAGKKTMNVCFLGLNIDTFDTIWSYTCGAAFALMPSPATGRLLSDLYTHLPKNNIVVFLRRSPIQVLTRIIFA